MSRFWIVLNMTKGEGQNTDLGPAIRYDVVSRPLTVLNRRCRRSSRFAWVEDSSKLIAD